MLLIAMEQGWASCIESHPQSAKWAAVPLGGSN
ncbi:hypothetical protein SAMN05446935_6106 [Burkholderia sp. YR290]|nr:hypothetical protein SAMN05446935_6106 [Burkholderia sp. YR290]